MDKTKFQKAKEWASTHRDGITITSIYGGALALVTGISYLAYKSEAKAVAEYNAAVADRVEWIETTLNDGKDVYALANGGLLVVPKDAETEIKLT